MVMSGLQGVAACPSCGSPCLVYREYLTPEQDHFVHDLRGGITNCELGTHVLRAATLDQGGEALARILRREDLV